MRSSTFFLAASLVSTICLTSNAHAEKADKFKPTTVSGVAGSAQNIDSGESKVMFNKIELTRGTLYIRAEKGTDSTIQPNKEFPEGGGSTVFIGTPTSPVFFKQKRDGGANLWIEGTAQKVEYDKATEVVVFSGTAVIRFLDQDKETRKLEGEYFSYDSPKDFFNMANSSSGKSVQNGGRVTITLEPVKAKTETKTSKP
jgi:lipopolysaccharide export system protein LptA